MGISENRDGHFRGNGYALTWTTENPLSLFLPQDQAGRRIRLSSLPLLPDNFPLALRKTTGRKGRNIADKAALKQLKVISMLLGECDSIINATDMSGDGEALFRYVYFYLQCEKPVRRLCVNSLSAKAIREGFGNLAAAHKYDSLFTAADCRRKSDLLLPANVNLALGITSGISHTFTHRLEIPVLALVCKRFFERREFKAARFYRHSVTLKKDGKFQIYAAACDNHDRGEAEAVYERLKTCPKAWVGKVERRTGRQEPPLPYSLVTLQKDAGERYGYTAANTFEIARSLYEKALITFPETLSRHIPETVFASIPGLIGKTGLIIPGFKDCAKRMNRESLNRQCVDEGKTSGRCAILPTGIIPEYLTREEKKIYRMIAGRLLEAFSPASEKESVKTEINCGGYMFRASTLRVLSRGWRSVLSLPRDREEHELDDTAQIPSFEEGEAADISGYNLVGKKTMPPSLHSEGSLLQELHDTGLARATDPLDVIEKLIREGYIDRSGKILFPTERGLVACHAVGEMRIADIGLAAGWEQALESVENGEIPGETYMKAIKIHAGQVTDEIIRQQ